MKSFVFAVGRHPLYPYVCVLGVTLAFLYTDPFTALNWRYLISYFGAVCGLLCVILLAKGKNSGNVLGIAAVSGECVANFMGGNIGAGLPSFYYAATHVYGLFSWQRHIGADDRVTVRFLSEKHFLLTIVFFIVAAFINVYLTHALAVENTAYQLMSNSFIFALGVVAQLLLVQRYSFNWSLWIILNVLVIGLNIYTDNPVIATQYLIYLFNATYGLFEWQDRERVQVKSAAIA